MSAKMDVILANCRGGTHDLKVIYSVSVGFRSEETVRWCKNCGSITVDIDFDGRRISQVIKMKSPEITKVLG